MKLFAVRHKTTGKLLPKLDGRGYSSWEPDHPDPEKRWDHALTPRLFHSKQAAVAFISQWVKGIATNPIEYDNADGYTYKSSTVVYKAQPHRAKEQLEVVPVYLLFGDAL